MSRAPIEDLRRTIDCLPLRTREAMLRGIREDDIIVGAYQTRGGNCPMLAAHRRGGRTSFLSFARAWDRFAAARSPRRATARELRVLERNLEESRAPPPGTPRARNRRRPGLGDRRPPGEPPRPQGRRGRPRGQRLALRGGRPGG